MDDGVDRVIVVAGDMPDLVPAVLRRLLDQVASGSPAAVLGRDDDAPPLPMAVHRRPAQIAARDLLDRGERRLRSLPDALDAFVVPEATWRADDPTAATLRDIDTRADLAPAPSKARLLQRLADDVVAFGPGRRVIVAVDGVDGAGKTIFADELAAVIAPQRPVLRASVDHFHRPSVERYERGRHSPEGFFRDSYDYDTLVRVLLDPFAVGGEVVAGVFDVVADAPRRLPATTPPADAVLILDGIFLHRAELVDRWDLSIFLDVPFSVSVGRMATRDASDPDPVAPSNRRYVEGQRLYLAESDPRSRATYVLDYSDVERPRIVRVLEGRQA